MSDQTKKDAQKTIDAIEDFNEKIAEDEKYENLKHENSKKKILIESDRVAMQLERLNQDKADLELAKKANYGALSEEQIIYIQKENDDYIKAAKSAMSFVHTIFDGMVPFFRKNLILIGAQTGQGKSTAVANIVFRVKDQISPVTGKPRRSLVLTNEERAEDVYNRVTSLAMGWSYTNHTSFTDEQTDTYRKAIPAWARGGLITVIDNTHGGSHGVTTSLEGIESVFENLLTNQEYYDCIIIDYYQNIITSKKDATMSENEVQARLTRMLDRYKNLYPAPIVLMAQMKPLDRDERTPWQERIKGRKIIADACTFIFEMAADFEAQTTVWTVWKSRFTQTVGKIFTTGWEKGKYVEHTEEFAKKVTQAKEERASKALDKKIGLPEIKPKEGSNGQ